MSGRYTQVLDSTEFHGPMFSCNDCGAYATTIESISHHDSCEPGESDRWAEFYSKANDEEEEMSNIPTLFDQGGVPAHVQAHAASGSSLVAPGGIDITRLSIRGKMFSIVMTNGTTIPLPTQDLDIIVLGASPEGSLVSRTYFDKGYVEGQAESPRCASNHGVFPTQWTGTGPVAQQCATCPMSAWESGKDQAGKPSKGKACSEGKTLYVLIAGIPQPDGSRIPPSQYVPNWDMAEVLELRLPPTSLKAMNTFGKALTAPDGTVLEPYVALTRVRFAVATWAQLEFIPMQFLPENQIAVAEQIAKQKVSSLITHAPAMEAAPAAPETQPHAAPPQLGFPQAHVAPAAAAAPAPQAQTPAAPVMVPAAPPPAAPPVAAVAPTQPAVPAAPPVAPVVPAPAEVPAPAPQGVVIDPALQPAPVPMGNVPPEGLPSAAAPAAPDTGPGWTQHPDGRYSDKHGTVFNPDVHGWARDPKGPAVTRDGSFRKKRGVDDAIYEAAAQVKIDALQATPQPAPAAASTPAAAPPPQPASDQVAQPSAPPAAAPAPAASADPLSDVLGSWG